MVFLLLAALENHSSESLALTPHSSTDSLGQSPTQVYTEGLETDFLPPSPMPFLVHAATFLYMHRSLTFCLGPKDSVSPFAHELFRVPALGSTDPQTVVLSSDMMALCGRSVCCCSFLAFLQRGNLIWAQPSIYFLRSPLVCTVWVQSI